MNLYVFVRETDGERWVTHAVDGYTVDEHGGIHSYRAVMAARGLDPEANDRYVIVRVPSDLLDRPFDPPEMEGEVKS